MAQWSDKEIEKRKTERKPFDEFIEKEFHSVFSEHDHDIVVKTWRACKSSMQQRVKELEAIINAQDTLIGELKDLRDAIAVAAFRVAAKSVQSRAANWATEPPNATTSSIDINAELRNEALAILALPSSAAAQAYDVAILEARAKEAETIQVNWNVDDRIRNFSAWLVRHVIDLHRQIAERKARNA